MKYILVWNNNLKPLTYLVCSTSPPCNRWSFFQHRFKGLYAEFLYGGKSKGRQLDGVLVLSLQRIPCSSPWVDTQ